jgi:hypothetical protein
MHWDHKLGISFAITNNRPTILPLPAGEGRGEGESFERESRAVHGEGELSERESHPVHGKNENDIPKVPKFQFALQN